MKKDGDKDNVRDIGKKKDISSNKKKKGGNGNGTDLFGAGLLDPDCVDPSWSGLNAVLRVKLW